MRGRLPARANHQLGRIRQAGPQFPVGRSDRARLRFGGRRRQPLRPHRHLRLAPSARFPEISSARTTRLSRVPTHCPSLVTSLSLRDAFRWISDRVRMDWTVMADLIEDHVLEHVPSEKKSPQYQSRFWIEFYNGRSRFNRVSSQWEKTSSD